MAEHSRVADPHVHRRRLRLAIRQARIDAGRTQSEVATALDWSLSKVVRIESGAVRISSTDLRALLEYYAVDDKTRVELLLMDAREARRPAGWAAYEPLLGRDFVSYLGFESSATQVRQFQATVIPGLLQTESYSRAVLTASTGACRVSSLPAARRVTWEVRMGQSADLVWRTSAASAGHDCVAVALSGDKVFVCHSRDTAGSVLEFTSAEWHAFLIGARAGEFDLEAS